MTANEGTPRWSGRFLCAAALCFTVLLAPPTCSQNLDAPEEAEPDLQPVPNEVRRGLETGRMETCDTFSGRGT